MVVQCPTVSIETERHDANGGNIHLRVRGDPHDANSEAYLSVAIKLENPKSPITPVGELIAIL
jgi:hypothetical protein